MSNKTINDINNDFYNNSSDSFDHIPFETIVPAMLSQFITGQDILEIGSGSGALASWLSKQGYRVTCIEPAQELAKKAQAKGLAVEQKTIQEFESENLYDSVIAFSSLIHVPKSELHEQIRKVVKLLRPQGTFFVSFIEGDSQELEDPTYKGKMRYFARWTRVALDELLSPYFELLQEYTVYNKKMDRIFLLRAYRLL